MTNGRLDAFCALLLAGLCLVPALANAQSCTADSQCAIGGRTSTATCVGDTLIVMRSVCAGTCRQIEERRQDCGPRAIGSITCSGNVAIRREGGCNASLGTCDSRSDREVCVPACSCRGNRLTVATGTCVTGSGCARSVVQCQNGCTCSPEPRCR